MKPLFTAAIGATFTAMVSMGAQAQNWIMASGYPDDNFHTMNIQMFLDEVAEKTDLAIDLQSNGTLMKIGCD